MLHIFPAMWLGHATQGLALMILSFTMLVSHGMAFMQDPGYIPLLDEGGCHFHSQSALNTAPMLQHNMQYCRSLFLDKLLAVELYVNA